MNPRYLALLTGILLFLAWPPIPLAPLLFVAFVPVLLFVEQVKDQPKAGKIILWWSFFGFMIWNGLSFFWIFNAGVDLGFFGAFGIFAAPWITESLFMAFMILLYHKVKRRFGNPIGFIALITGWIGYEYFQQEWELTFPWMTLGNGFAIFHSWIQWYEFTGIFGGSLWVLLVNMLIFTIIQRKIKAETGALKPVIISLALVLVLPIGISLARYYTYEEAPNPSNIVVVQPNVDPFSEKFGNMPPARQLERMIRLSDSLGQPNTEFFIWPETSIIPTVYEDKLSDDPSVNVIQAFLKKYPNANVLTGATTLKWYAKEKPTSTAHYYEAEGIYYDYYNAALLIENSERVQVYHKSKLVPGVESFPYVEYLGPLAPIVQGLGGGLGKDNDRPVFYTQSGIGVAPAVCYESIFGAFMAKNVGQDAQFIAVITNDGWWKDTSGYRQHALYAKLRAIETRRSIARSANTGISSFINQRGDVLQKTAWWTQTAIKADINLNSTITFYSIYGDYIAKACFLIGWGFIVVMTVLGFRKQRV